jgi:hypothetical protein
MATKSGRIARRNAALTLALALGILVLANVLVQWVPLRLDLTDTQRYRLSDVSLQAARALDGVEVRAFVSPDLPNSLSDPWGRKRDIRGVAREFLDRLAEYETRSGGRMTVIRVQARRGDATTLEDKAREARLELFTGKEAEVEGGRLEFRKYALGATFQYRDQIEVLPLALDPETLEFEITKRLTRLKEKADLSGGMQPVLDAAATVGAAAKACDDKVRSFQGTGDATGDLGAIVGGGGGFAAAMRAGAADMKRTCDAVAAGVAQARPLATGSDLVARLVESAEAYVETVDHLGRLAADPQSDESALQLLAERLVQIGALVDEDAAAVKDSPGRKTIGFLCGHREFCPFADPRPLIQPELLQMLGQSNPMIAQFAQAATRIEQQIDQVNEQLRRGLFERRDLQLKRVDAGRPIPDDVAALVVFGAQRPMSPRDQYVIDQFLLSGRSVLVFLDTWDIAVHNLRPADDGLGSDALVADVVRRQAWPTNLSDFLAHYGVRPTGTLVVEPERHEAITVLQVQKQGQFTVQGHRSFPYPLLPTFVDMDRTHVLVRNLPALTLPYATTLQVTDAARADADLEVVELVRTSDQAIATVDDVPVSPPQLLGRLPAMLPNGPHTVAVAVKGRFRSYFDGKEIPKAASTPDDPPVADAPFRAQGRGRLLVVGSNLGLENLSTERVFEDFTPGQLTSGRGDFFLKIRDYVANLQNWQLRLGQIGPVVQANVDFLHNALDWGIQNEALVDIRSKAWTQRPIRNVSGGARTAVTVGMIVGLPLAFALAGLVRFVSRRRAR